MPGDRGQRGGRAVDPGVAPGTSDLVIGLVTDVGTLDDHNFNQYSWEGVLQGAAIIGAPEPAALISTGSADYEDNINSFVDDGANVIVTVGFALGAATLAAAEENPDIHFVGVDQFQANTDFGGDWEPLSNYESIIFNEAQAGYLAGILAGSITESGEVAALGGSGTIPPVVNYMRGFENGVASVNADANVQLKYVSNDLAVAFNDPTTGKTFADQFLEVNPDVDVLFQVAGKTGNGILDSVVEHGIYGFGVDVDQWISYPSAQVCIVTSAEKHLTMAVSESIVAGGGGEFRSNNVFYGADNDGIGLAPYYQFADLVPRTSRRRSTTPSMAWPAATSIHASRPACATPVKRTSEPSSASPSRNLAHRAGRSGPDRPARVSRDFQV